MAFLGQEQEIRELQDRFKFLYGILFVAFSILILRMVYLQILNGDKLRIFSEENRIKRVKIPAPRGMIFDRRHKLLIDNRPAFDLEITPQYLKDYGNNKEVLDKLSSLIRMPKEEIQKKHISMY